MHLGAWYTDYYVKKHCQHKNRLDEVKAFREGNSSVMAWIRARLSFAILRATLLCVRGSRTKSVEVFGYHRWGFFARTRLNYIYINNSNVVLCHYSCSLLSRCVCLAVSPCI